MWDGDKNLPNVCMYVCRHACRYVTKVKPLHQGSVVGSGRDRSVQVSWVSSLRGAVLLGRLHRKYAPTAGNKWEFFSVSSTWRSGRTGGKESASLKRLISGWSIERWIELITYLPTCYQVVSYSRFLLACLLPSILPLTCGVHTYVGK